jgi:hypothetical protein
VSREKELSKDRKEVKEEEMSEMLKGEGIL